MSQNISRPKYASDSTRSDRRREQKLRRKREQLEAWQLMALDMLPDLQRAIQRCKDSGPEYQTFFENLLDEKRILHFIASRRMTMKDAVYSVICEGAWTIHDISHEVKLGASVILTILIELKKEGMITQSHDIYKPKD